MVKLTDLVSKIINYETGYLSKDDTLDLFAELIRKGLAWSLQGHYGRTAIAFIEGGWISRKGEVLKRP